MLFLRLLSILAATRWLYTSRDVTLPKDLFCLRLIFVSRFHCKLFFFFFFYWDQMEVLDIIMLSFHVLILRRRGGESAKGFGTRVHCPVLVHSLATLDAWLGSSGPGVGSTRPMTCWRSTSTLEATEDKAKNYPLNIFSLVGFWLSVAWLQVMGMTCHKTNHVLYKGWLQLFP